ncbi:MAG: RNA-guided endonuclease TnpB family protein [Bacilli bacterium]
MKEILKAYRIQCYPNNVQKTLFRKNFGASRFAFNFALERKKAAFDKKERIPNAIELHRELNKLKGTDELPWAYEVSKCSFQEALRDCDKAFNNFFTRCKKKIKGKKGFPKFKSKKNDKQSFRLNGSISIEDGYCWLPRIGKIKLSENDYFADDSKILSATISKKADKWFVSFQVKQHIQELPKLDKIVGVDLGVKTLATSSDGNVFENPKALSKNLKKLKRQQRQLSRKTKGSKNREKAKQKVARLHYRIGNIRKDVLHKATTKLIRENQTIVLEDLNVSGMVKNHCLARAVNDAGMFEFRRMLEYKARWYGREIQYADTFYPSSKTCSNCGWKNDDLKLSDRIFKCQICHHEMDRDLNAALNLKKLYTASSAGIYAFGDGSSDCSVTNDFSPSLKKESNGKFTYTLKRGVDFCKF